MPKPLRSGSCLKPVHESSFSPLRILVPEIGLTLQFDTDCDILLRQV